MGTHQECEYVLRVLLLEDLFSSSPLHLLNMLLCTTLYCLFPPSFKSTVINYSFNELKSPAFTFMGPESFHNMYESQYFRSRERGKEKNVLAPKSSFFKFESQDSLRRFQDKYNTIQLLRNTCQRFSEKEKPSSIKSCQICCILALVIGHRSAR